MWKNQNIRKTMKARAGIYARRTERKIQKENNVIKCSEDTIIRTEIHGIIISKIREGKSKEDIIGELSKNSRYKNYSIYFENWITDKMKKQAKREERQK